MMARSALQSCRKLHGLDVARAEPCDLVALDSGIGEGMGQAHIAETDDQNPLRAH